MAYVTLMHFMTQLFRQSVSSLGRAPFVWHVRFGIFFWLCVSFGKLFWFCGNGVVVILRFGCMNILEWVMKSGRKLLVFS